MRITRFLTVFALSSIVNLTGIGQEAHAQAGNIDLIMEEVMNQLANKPGFSRGPLSGAGVPKVKNNSSSEEQNPVDLPDSGGDSWQENECNGGNCNTDLALMEQPGVSMSAAVVSPMGALQETMDSEKTQNLLSADRAKGGKVLSPLGNAIQSWYQVAPNTASAMIQSISMANEFTSQRYQAEQNAELAFASAGSQGRVLSQAYRNCIGSFVQQGYAYSAAQEVCLKNQGESKGAKKENIEIFRDQAINFGTHPSHPLFKGNVSVRKYTGEWSTVAVDNSKAPDLNEIFPLDQLGGDEEAQKKVIRLRHLMFMPTLANLAPGMNVFEPRHEEEILFAVRQLAGDWLRLFGDIEYQYQKGGEEYSSFMAMSPRRISPTFLYSAAVDLLGSGSSGWKRDLFEANDKKSIGYRQFVTFREHLVYDRLWRTTANYCRVLAKRKDEDPASIKAQYEGFWNLNSGVATENKISNTDIQILSNSFMVMDEALGNDLWRYVKERLKGSESLCDLIDPMKATGSGSTDLNGATSVAKLVAQKLLSKTATATDTTALDEVRSDFFTLAKIIAGDQVNTTIMAAFRVLGTISGGDFESRVRDTAVRMVAETAGQFDPQTRRAQLMNAFQQFKVLLNNKIQAKK